jgi:signal transduction histidine kinase
VTLANFIAAHRECILEAWERRASARVPRLANSDNLRDQLGELLGAIARELASNDRTNQIDNASAREAAGNVQVVAEKHGAGRAREGMTVQDMVREFPVLRSSVMREWIRSVAASTLDDLEEALQFDEALDRALTESLSEFMDRLNHSRETFLGILGHDLRNPLSTIITGARLLRDEDLGADRSRDVAKRIVATGERMHHLVIDLLDFTRTRLSGQMPIERRKWDLATTVHEAAGEFATEHPERILNVDVSGDLTGMWDEKRMSQAVGNLLGNAVQHGAPDMPIEVSARADERQVSIAVHNDGPAIPEGERRALFHPLRAGSERRASGSNSKHLGLGLYIARAIAAAHGGGIDVESSADRGTTFTIRLPRRTGDDDPTRENWAA